MTELEWLTCTAPEKMLKFVDPGVRKGRLFACECCRQAADLIADARCLEAVQVAERFADGLGDPEDLVGAFQVTSEIADEQRKMQGNAAAVAADLANVACEESSEIAYYAYMYLLDLTQEDIRPVRQAWAKQVVHCVWGPLHFRPVTIAPTWRTANVVGVARTIYDDRGFTDMPVLAAALEDAGCDNKELLAHCRSRGPHVRGCWSVDLLLGKG